MYITSKPSEAAFGALMVAISSFVLGWFAKSKYDESKLKKSEEKPIKD